MPMTTRSLVLWLSSGLLCCLLGRAAAAEEKGLAVVLEPKLEGSFTQAEQARLEAAMAQGLKAADLQALPSADREAILSGEPELRGCRTDECQERIGRLLSAQAVLAPIWEVRRMEPPPAGHGPRETGKRRGAQKAAPTYVEGQDAWQFTLAHFNVPIGAVGAKELTTCDSCTLEQAAQALFELTKKVVLLDAARPRGKIEVTATPSADVLVDGRKLGFTPYRREAFAGKHDIAVARTGYRTHHQTVIVDEGKKVALDVKLKQGSDKTYKEERRPRPIWRLAVGGGAIAVGVLMMGFGGSALSVNGQCVEEQMIAGMAVCPASGPPGMKTIRVFDTVGMGAGLVTVGALLTISGGVLIALPGQRRIVEVTAGALGTGTGLRLAGSF
jgi:hypothetical protein